MLLIQLLLGKAVGAIMTRVSVMTDEDVQAAIKAESDKTESLLAEMRSIT